jgi:SagB-type dehydrogenase family enzyme
MARYRRSRYLLFTLEELADSGTASSTKWVATSIISGLHLLVEIGQMEMFREVSCLEWTDENELAERGFTGAQLKELVTLAIFISDDPAFKSFLDQEAILIESHWPPCAASFHLLNQYRESFNSRHGSVRETSLLERESEQRALRFLQINGPPPPTFYSHPQAENSIQLDRDIGDSPLASALLRRRTCRYFESEKSLGFHQLSTLLRLTFGPFAIRRLARGGIELVQKTSPSGGSLHPIEGFPLLFRTEAGASGLYHYRCDQHALALLKEIPEQKAREAASYFAQGQSFVGSCAAIVILVARFDRHFWKYRERENSYAVILQDAGHLSQTFQVVATDLGLSTFYTAAINGVSLTQFLGLRFPAEAALGILGVGYGVVDEMAGTVSEPFIFPS